MRWFLRISYAVTASLEALLVDVFATLHPKAILSHPTDSLGVMISCSLMCWSLCQFQRLGKTDD